MLSLILPVESPALVRFVEPAPSLPLEISLESPGSLSQQFSSLLKLDFGDLPSFTTVHNQYQAWGVVMTGAMAIQPSNPAFIDAEHSTGLMAAVGSQPLTIHFQQMQQMASLSLVGAQQITLRAYDLHNHLLTQQQVGQPDYCQSRQVSSTCVRHQVLLAAKGMVRLEVYSDAPFLLHGLIYG